MVDLGHGVTLLLRSDYGGHFAGRAAMARVSELWVHHSVTNEDIGVLPTESAADDFRELDAIGVSRGHRGMSYSYAIHPQGVVGEGQGRNIGAHTLNHNSSAFGIVFIGNFEDDELTPEAIHAFRVVRDHLILVGALSPGVYPTGGHSDTFATACPGRNVYAHLDLLREPVSAPKPPPPPPKPKGPHNMHCIGISDGRYVAITPGHVEEVTPEVYVFLVDKLDTPHDEDVHPWTAAAVAIAWGVKAH